MRLVVGALTAKSEGRSGNGFAAAKRLLPVECELWRSAVREMLSGWCDACSNCSGICFYTPDGAVGKPARCSETLHR